jgi:hypothetical protein
VGEGGVRGYGGVFQRTPTTVTFYGYRLVVPMVVGSAILMLLVSLLTPPPSRATIDKYFPTRRGENGSGAVTDPAV